MGGIIIFACLTAHLVILLLVLPGKSTRSWNHLGSMFVLISVTNSIYRILEYPRIMRKQYSFFHFPSSYTKWSSKILSPSIPVSLALSQTVPSLFSFRSIFQLLIYDLTML